MIEPDMERRVHRRIYFSLEDRVVGELSAPGAPERTFTAPILNISLGGLHFALKKEVSTNIRSGDILVLREISAHNRIVIPLDSSIEVKWMLSHESLSQVGYGCEFRNLAADAEDRILKFIDYMYS